MHRSLLCAFLAFATAPMALAQTASAPLDAVGSPAAPPSHEGGVRLSGEGVCMEPGHPNYATASITGAYPSMRACVASGGRRDGPRDMFATPPAGPTEPGMDPTVPPSISPPTEAPLSDSIPTSAGPENIPSPTEILGGMPASDPLASQSLEDPGLITPPAPPKPPRGIELSEVPSYSENPTIFRPPEEYIGRGPREFLP